MELDEETVASLPVMSLDEVRKYDGLQKPPSMAGLEGDGGSDATVVMVGSTPSASAPGGDAANAPLYATYEGIVYDVTSFAEHHPGGRELLRTAAGLDLKHFFENYRVHSQTDKAAQWLAPLAVGKLTPEDAKRAEEMTTPEVHVEKRMKHLGRARRQTMLVACSLPFWVMLRNLIAAIGSAVPSLAKLLAKALPVAVPGYSGGRPPRRKRGPGAGGAAAEAEAVGGACDEAALEAAAKAEAAVPGRGRRRRRRQVQGGGDRGRRGGLRRGVGPEPVGLRRDPVRGAGADQRQRAHLRLGLLALPQRGAGERLPGQQPQRQDHQVLRVGDGLAGHVLQELHGAARGAGVETVPMPSPGSSTPRSRAARAASGAPTQRSTRGPLREVFKKDFEIYHKCELRSQDHGLVHRCELGPAEEGRHALHVHEPHGLRDAQPLERGARYSLFKWAGGSDLWWDVVFTPFYTASFLVDELRPSSPSSARSSRRRSPEPHAAERLARGRLTRGPRTAT